MYFSKFITSLYLSTLFLLLQSVFGDHACLSSNNFTTQSPYDANLIELINYLTYEAPLTGFSLGSKGRGPDKVYGISMCIGAVSAEECRTCMVGAVKRLQTVCPYNKGATISTSSCLLKYHNEDFFGQFDDSNKFYIENQQNVSDPTLYGQKIGELLNNLTIEAYTTPKMLEMRGIMIKEKEKLAGLTQCTRDISSMECRKCLDDAIKLIPQCCGSKKQVVVFGGSCVVAYEVTLVS